MSLVSDTHYDTENRDMKKPDINAGRKASGRSKKMYVRKRRILPMPVKLLHHMTCQINQKIYSYPKEGNLGNCPLFKEKGTRLCDGFIPDEANLEALLKVGELFPFAFCL